MSRIKRLTKQRRVTIQSKLFKTLYSIANMNTQLFLSIPPKNTPTSCKTKSTSCNSVSIDFNPTNIKKAQKN